EPGGAGGAGSADCEPVRGEAVQRHMLLGRNFPRPSVGRIPIGSASGQFRELSGGVVLDPPAGGEALCELTVLDVALLDERGEVAEPDKSRPPDTVRGKGSVVEEHV